MRELLANKNNGHEYSESEINGIVLINIVGSIISFIGCLFVMFNYWLFPSLRRSLSYKIILWIAISDIIYHFSFFLGAPTNKGVCIFQAMIQQIGSIASLFYVVAICWVLNYLTHLLRMPTPKELKKLLARIHIVVWGLSIITTIGPLFTDSYGQAGGWCWVKGETTADIVWRYACFYGWIVVGIIYMLFIYAKMWNRIKMVQNEKDESAIDDEEFKIVSEDITEKDEVIAEMTQTKDLETEPTHSPNAPIATNDDDMEQQTQNVNKNKKNKKDKSLQHAGNKALRRMILFPVILIVVWGFALMRRIVDTALGTSGTPYAFAVMQAILQSLIGAFDAVVYGLTKDVRRRDVMLFKRYCLFVQPSPPPVATEMNEKN